MTFFLETLIGGLLAGTMYSLVAIGFVLIYKASGVFNFAQGAMLLFAALTFVSLQELGAPFALALLLTVPVMFGDVMVSQFDLVAAATAAVLVGALALLFNKTRIGVSLRAVADDTRAALSIGIDLNRIWQIVWAVAGVVGLVAGLLWGARQGVQFSLSLVVLKALPVLIIGGFTSIGGAIVGGLIVGAAENLAEVYVGAHIGGGITPWFAYFLALAFLYIRPAGLFGERAIERV